MSIDRKKGIKETYRMRLNERKDRANEFERKWMAGPHWTNQHLNPKQHEKSFKKIKTALGDEL